jgi:AraC-like DNA-binding protein
MRDIAKRVAPSREKWTSAASKSHPQLRLLLFAPASVDVLVSRCLRGRAQLFRADDWTGVRHAIVSLSLDVAVLDPAAGGWIDSAQIVGIRRCFPDLPLLAYVSSRRDAVRLIVELHAAGVPNIFLHGDDVAPHELIQAIANALEVHDRGFLPGDMKPNLETLPNSFRSAINEVFARPNRFDAASDIALLAGASRVQLYRLFSRARLPSPKRLLIAARLLRAYQELRYSRTTAIATAKTVGYTGMKVFASHTALVFRCTPGGLRRIPEEQVSASLSAWLQAGVGLSAAPAH